MADRGSIWSLYLEQALATLCALGTTAPTPLGCHLPSEGNKDLFHWGLAVPRGALQPSTDTLAASAVPWPGPCLSGLADLAEEQRTPEDRVTGRECEGGLQAPSQSEK